MVDYNDDESTYNLLKKMHKDWEDDSYSYSYDVEQFSRKNLTKQLAEVFDGALL